MKYKVEKLDKVVRKSDEVDLEKEKNGSLNILASIVPAAEVFFRPTDTKQSTTGPKSKCMVF